MFVGYYYHDMPTPIEALVNHGYTVVNTLAFSWSVATNVWATAMIAYKAWYVLLIRQFPWNVAQSTYHCLDRQQRKELKRYLVRSSLAVHEVLMLLVDLGVIYTFFMVRASSINA